MTPDYLQVQARQLVQGLGQLALGESRVLAVVGLAQLLVLVSIEETPVQVADDLRSEEDLTEKQQK